MERAKTAGGPFRRAGRAEEPADGGSGRGHHPKGARSRLGRRLSAAGLIVVLVSSLASARQWQAIESREVNLRLRVPPRWQTKTGTRKERAYLEAVSPDGSMFLYASSFRDPDLSLDDVLDGALDELGVNLDDDPNEEDLNGLDALVGETTATFNGRDVGMFIVAAAHGNTCYVAYLMTREAMFDANARVMNRILDSFAPLARR